MWFFFFRLNNIITWNVHLQDCWIERRFTRPESQDKSWIPPNEITTKDELKCEHAKTLRLLSPSNTQPTHTDSEENDIKVAKSGFYPMIRPQTARPSLKYNGSPGSLVTVSSFRSGPAGLSGSGGQGCPALRLWLVDSKWAANISSWI